MKGKGEKHENEGFYGEKRRENEVIFGRGGKGKMVLAVVIFLRNQQDFRFFKIGTVVKIWTEA